MAGPLDIGEAEGRQSRCCDLFGEDPLALVCEVFEQGSKPQPLVNGADRRLVPAQLVEELIRRARRRRTGVAEDPREPVDLDLVRRDRVHLLLVVELQAVLDGAQEPVRGRQLVSVVPVDVSGVGQLVERKQRRGRA